MEGWELIHEAWIKGLTHNDVMTWKCFLHYWPFVWGIHRSPVDSPHKGPEMQRFDVFFCLFAISCWTNSPVASDFRCLNSHVTLQEWFWYITFWSLSFWKKIFLFWQVIPEPIMTQFTDMHCNVLPIEHKVIQNVLFGIYSKSCGSCVCCWSRTLMTKFGLCTSLGLPYERL